ncbi:MAG: hypothetical protein JWQ38_3332 [Flavipsychrobacter sp.]|nr:hypothetical protein [Flavipsychrobacter sp.]
MVTKAYEEYRNIALKPIIEKLQSEHYDSIAMLCTTLKKQCNKMRELEKSESPLQYVVLCENVIAEVEQHVTNRRSVYIPYVHTLSDKVKDNHNCSNCTGTCKINHDMHIMDLNATNDTMAKVLHRLQMATLPLYSDTLYPDEYRVLRSGMTLLETSLTELFFLENNYLIPKIAEAQKNINAGNN